MSETANGHPQERLSAYLDDELDIEQRTEVDRHLASCDACRSQLSSLGRLKQAVAGDTVPPVPSGLKEKIGKRLDEATVIRTRRFRLALPATIAATIGAIGILIAVKWRQGELAPPPVRAREVLSQSERQESKKAADTVAAVPAPSAAPARTASPVPPPAPADVPARKAKERDKDFHTSVGGVSGGTPGGVVGGVEGGVESAVPSAEPSRADANRAAAASRVAAAPQPPPAEANEESRDRFLQKPVAPVPAQVEPQAAAKAERPSVCADRWSYSGVLGTWESGDPEATAGELNKLARDLGGMGQWRGIEDGRPYLLVVPRSRYTEAFRRLRAHGVTGLGEPPALAPGDDCTAISIAIVRPR